MSGMNWHPATGVCEICHEAQATEWHHLFSKTRTAKRLYPDEIHDRKNLLKVCHPCHEHAPHISEREFCERLGIETRSKSGKL